MSILFFFSRDEYKSKIIIIIKVDFIWRNKQIYLKYSSCTQHVDKLNYNSKND